MKTTLLISGVLLALTSSMALAGAVDFAWNDCYGNTGSSLSKNFANCATVTTSAVAVAAGSFILDNPIPDFDALEVAIDLQVEGSSMPAWWDFQPGGCHAPSLSMTFDFSVLPNLDGICTDPFGQPATGSLANYSMAGNQARTVGVAAIDAASPQPIVAGVDYYGVRLALRQDKSSGAGSCAGCATKVTLLLEGIRALGNAPTSHEDCTHPAHNQCIIYQGTGGTNCSAVPVRALTWGSIKSLYR